MSYSLLMHATSHSHSAPLLHSGSSLQYHSHATNPPVWALKSVHRYKILKWNENLCDGTTILLLGRIFYSSVKSIFVWGKTIFIRPQPHSPPEGVFEGTPFGSWFCETGKRLDGCVQIKFLWDFEGHLIYIFVNKIRYVESMNKFIFKWNNWRSHLQKCKCCNAMAIAIRSTNVFKYLMSWNHSNGT